MHKKIFQITTRLNVGGPTKFIKLLVVGMNKIGWNNIVVFGNVEKDEDDMRILFDNLEIKQVKFNNLTRTISIIKDLKSIVNIYKLVKKEKPSIVHTHMSKAALVGRLSVMFYNLLYADKVKLVHTFHGHTFHGYFSPLKEKVFLSIERFLAKYATDKIITISNQQQHEILNIYKVGNKKQHEIINLGVDTEFSKYLDKKTLRNDFKLPLDARVFGIIGRIAEIKNHKLFIDSVQKFNAMLNYNIYFIIIGDGEKEFVNNLKLYAKGIDNIIFIGNQMNPKYFYGALDFLVLTSKNEGTPVTILEAFACEIPVISTAVGGVVDLIGNNNERGYLVDEDANKLAKSYNELLNDDYSLKVQEAKLFVENHYSIENLVNNVDKLYLNLLEC